MNGTDYSITSLETTSTFSNGTTVSTVVFVVEFKSSVLLKENISSVMEEELSTSGATYMFVQLVAVKPSGMVYESHCPYIVSVPMLAGIVSSSWHHHAITAEFCSCRASSGHLANLCIGTSSSPCDCSDLGTCKVSILCLLVCQCMVVAFKHASSSPTSLIYQSA